MTRRLAALFLSTCLLGASVAHAQTPPAPEIAARGYLLVDLTANQVLAEHNADAPAEPASLTKLMTAYVVFQALRDKKLSLTQRLTVHEQTAWMLRSLLEA